MYSLYVAIACSNFPDKSSDFPDKISDFPDKICDFPDPISDFPDQISDFPDKISDPTRCVSICIRYLSNHSVHEEFVSLCETENLDALSLKNCIVRSLHSINANLLKCVGQAYDGAMVMSGRVDGV